MSDSNSLNDVEMRFNPSINGILQCLKFLAAEAASLKLLRTLSAIEDALETAICESDMGSLERALADVSPVLH